MRSRASSESLRYTVPIILENLLTVTIGMAVSAVIGGISASSLSSVLMINSVLNVINGVLSICNAGSGVLVARYVGEGNRDAASKAIEQSVLMSALFGIAGLIVCEAAALPILRLLLPSVEEAVFSESMLYYRVLMLVLPLQMVINAVSSVLRASGETKSAMVCMVLMNLSQLLFAFLFIRVIPLAVTGAGLSLLMCYAFGLILLLIPLLRGRRHYHVRVKGFFRPEIKVARQLLRLGLPMTVEALAVRFGYMLANSLAMGLGTHDATAFQITNQLNTFTSLPQTITIMLIVPLVGHALGAGEYTLAKKRVRVVLTVALSISVALAVTMAAFGSTLAGLYTQDASVRADSAALMWLMIGYAITGCIVNVLDPALRTAGDLRHVMIYTTAGVWLVRLPLTWLMCYVWHMGAFGVQLANIISIGFRAGCGISRILRGKWVYLKLEK